MPKLPSAEDLGRRTPTARSGIVSMSTAASERIARSAGERTQVQSQAIDEFQRINEKREDRYDKLALAKMENYTLGQVANLEQQVREELDPVKAREMWESGFGDIKKNALAMSPNSKRAEASVGLDGIYAKSLGGINRIVREKEVANGRAEGIENLQNTTNTVVSAINSGNIELAIGAINNQKVDDRLRYEGGIYTPEEYATMKTSTPEAIVETALASIPASEAVKILDDTDTEAAVRRFAIIESGNDPEAVNGSHEGLLQFHPDTARSVGLDPADRTDPEKSVAAGVKLYESNAKVLKKKLGQEPTEAQVYLAHQQGASGASALLKNPDKNAVDVLESIGVSPKRAKLSITGNGGTADMTAGEFTNYWAQRYAKETGSIASYLSPAKASKYRKDASEQLVYQTIDEDPKAALSGLNDGSLGVGFEPQKIKDLKAQAINAQANLRDKNEAIQIANEVANNKDALGPFYTGEMTLQDIAKYEATNGVTPASRYMKAALLKDVPEPADTAKAAEYVKLSNQLNDIKLYYGGKVKKGKVTGGTFKFEAEGMKRYQQFQSDVLKAMESKLIEEGEGQRLLNEMSGPFLDAVNKNLSSTKGSFLGYGRWGGGVQDPYREAFSRINSYLKDNGMTDNLMLKRDMIARFSDYLGKFDEKGNFVPDGTYESSGNTAKDNAVVSAAFKAMIKDLNITNYPGLEVSAAIPVRITTDKEYEDLDPGTQFIGPDEKVRTKPGVKP